MRPGATARGPPSTPIGLWFWCTDLTVAHVGEMTDIPKEVDLIAINLGLCIPKKREHVLVLMYRRGDRFRLQLPLVAARQHRALVLAVGLERARMRA